MEAERVGLIVVGLGSVGSSILAGIEATRAHLVHPFGTLTDAGGAGKLPGTGALREHAPVAELNDFVLGAFELREDDAYRAALRAGVVQRSLVDELRPQLRQIRSMLGARETPTRRHLADALAEDIRGFLAHHHCGRGVVVCTVPGASIPQGKLPFTAAELSTGLEESAGWVSPGLVYAHAAAQASCAFVGVAQDEALLAPGLGELFATADLPLAGAGLLGPDAALREVLATLLGAEGLGLAGTASLSTRVEERGARLWGGPDRTQEMSLANGFSGGAFELSLELRGPVSLYLAGRALDAALLVDLAARAGHKGPQEWMSALFASHLGSTTPREAAEGTLAARRERLRAELPLLVESIRRRAA